MRGGGTWGGRSYAVAMWCAVVMAPTATLAAPVLTISTMPAPSANVPPPDGTNPPPPITWNVLGLDSNKPTTDGPDTFLSGARVCNVGNATATNVTATYTFTSANTYINLVPGSASTLNRGSLAAGACTDFFFNILVTRTAAAYSTARRFVISATADGLGTITTPCPRELFVEHLVSQNRNGTNSIVPGGAATCSGSPLTCTMSVGDTATFTFNSFTATGGYEQLSAVVPFPNTIFDLQGVAAQYNQPLSPLYNQNSTVYADACGWNNDPTSPNYKEGSGGNPGCNLTDMYSGGKAGGDPISTTYTVTAIGTGSATMNELIYDFSGSSYHYNNDLGLAANTLIDHRRTAGDRDADAESDQHTDADAHADQHPDGDADAHTDRHADRHRHRDAHRDTDAHADRHADDHAHEQPPPRLPRRRQRRPRRARRRQRPPGCRRPLRLRRRRTRPRQRRPTHRP